MKHLPNIVRYAAVLTLLLFALALGGCAALGIGDPPNARVKRTWTEVSKDGRVSKDEMARVDAELDSAVAREESQWGWLSDYATELFALGGPIGVGTGVVVNKMRNAARAKRGEPVVVPKPTTRSHPASPAGA